MPGLGAEDCRARESLIPFDPLFPEEAKVPLQVFNDLRMVDAPGSPTLGEISRPWVTDFVSSIFGAYDAETGRRLVTEFFMLSARRTASHRRQPGS